MTIAQLLKALAELPPDTPVAGFSLQTSGAIDHPRVVHIGDVDAEWLQIGIGQYQLRPLRPEHTDRTLAKAIAVLNRGNDAA